MSYLYFQMLVRLLSFTPTSFFFFHFLVVNKVQMLEEGVAERIQALLRSEMPPVQFKLLGTLRMLTDGQGKELLIFTDVNYMPPPPPPARQRMCKETTGYVSC